MDIRLKQDEIAVLNYHLTTLHAQKTDYAYFIYLVRRVIPLIKTLCSGFLIQWDEAQSDYLSQREALGERVLCEVKGIYDELRCRLEAEGLLNDDLLSGALNSLDSIFNFEADKPFIQRKSWVMPLRYEELVNGLKQLFFVIAEVGRTNLIEKYAQVIYVPEYSQQGKITHYQCNNCFVAFSYQVFHQELLCNICGEELVAQDEVSVVKKPYIEYFNKDTFVPSYFKWLKLDNDFWESAAGIWSTLSLVKWSWCADPDKYFRKKLRYKDDFNCERAANLLEFRAFQAEVQMIKKKVNFVSHYEIEEIKEGKRLEPDITLEMNKKGKKSVPRFLDRPYMNKQLSKLLEMIGSCSQNESILAINGPIGLELCLIGEGLYNQAPYHLRLKIRWPGDIIEEVHLHSFHDEESNYRYNFFKQLIHSKDNKAITSSNGVSGADAIKYLQEAGLTDELASLFILDATTQEATLKSTSINLAGQSDKFMRKLCRQLQKYRSVGWDRC